MKTPLRRALAAARARDCWFALLALLALLALSLGGALPSLSLLEALWLWTILGGLRFAGANFRSALGDRAYIAAKRLNGGRRIVANNGVRRERLRLVSLAALLAIGLYAATPTAARPPWITGLPALCIIAVGVSLTVNSFLDARERAALLVLLSVVDKHDRREWEHERDHGRDHGHGAHPGGG